MKICIIAFENKMDVTEELCVRFCGALCRHTVLATGTAAKQIENTAGFRTEALLGVSSGGIEQVTQLVACGDCGLVLCLRDASPLHEPVPELADLVRTCDFYGVPVATGLATARILLQNLSVQNNAAMFKKGSGRN